MKKKITKHEKQQRIRISWQKKDLGVWWNVLLCCIRRSTSKRFSNLFLFCFLRHRPENQRNEYIYRSHSILIRDVKYEIERQAPLAGKHFMKSNIIPIRCFRLSSFCLCVCFFFLQLKWVFIFSAVVFDVDMKISSLLFSNVSFQTWNAHD